MEKGRSIMLSWRVTIKDYSEKNYYRVLLMITGYKYKVGDPFHYEDKKDEAWHKSLEYATKLEKDIMSILGNDDIAHSNEE